MIDATREKTAHVIHYIISHTQPADLGIVKLCKVMWYADLTHYRLYGKTITGQMSYIRKELGPVPNHLYAVLDQLKEQDLIYERPQPTPAGIRREFIFLKPAQASWFSSGEIETLREAIDTITLLSASEASERTHGPLWDEMKEGEQMCIRAASVLPRHLEQEDIDRLLEHPQFRRAS